MRDTKGARVNIFFPERVFDCPSESAKSLYKGVSWNRCTCARCCHSFVRKDVSHQLAGGGGVGEIHHTNWWG